MLRFLLDSSGEGSGAEAADNDDTLPVPEVLDEKFYMLGECEPSGEGRQSVVLRPNDND